MIDPRTYFIVEEVIFPEESGGVTGYGSFDRDIGLPDACEQIQQDDTRGEGFHERPSGVAGTSSPPTREHLSARQARQLVADARYFLDTNGVTHISKDAAAALARFDGSVSLDSLIAISPEAAAEFRLHCHPLGLNGLSSLDAATARSLAAHPGRLELNGLAELPAGTQP